MANVGRRGYIEIMKSPRKHFVARLIVAAMGFSLFVGAPAQAEELYTLQNANGQLTAGATLVCSDDVCGPSGSFSTNPATMAQISASYGCSPTPCTFVHVNNQTRLPITPEQDATAKAAAKTTADAAAAASAKLAEEAAVAAASAATAAGATQQEAAAAAAATTAAANSNSVSGIGITVDSISQTDIQFGICFYSRNQSRITYTNVSYSWTVTDTNRTLDSGSGPPSGVTLIESGACNYGNSKLVNVRVSNLAPGTSYFVETRGNNAGVQFSNREAFTTQAASVVSSPIASETNTVRSETVTASIETRTAQMIESATVLSAPLTQGALPLAPSGSAGAVPLESDGEEIDAPPTAEIGVRKESSGKFLISLESNVYEEQLLVRAFKKGSKLVIFRVSTNVDGRAAIRTNRNLTGFKLAVYVGDQFLDSVKI
jgi:hypothetical protein